MTMKTGPQKLIKRIADKVRRIYTLFINLSLPSDLCSNPKKKTDYSYQQNIDLKATACFRK